MGKNRRDSITIIGNILYIASEHGKAGINHTGLLRKANLSHGNLCKLVANLTSASLINEEFRDGQRIYSITSKGIEYLNKHKQFALMAEAFGLKL